MKIGILLLSFFLSLSVHATENIDTKKIDLNNLKVNSEEEFPNDFFVDLRFGFSPYIGVIGVELQKSNYSVGIGKPGSLSVKYYINPHKDSYFTGVYYLRYIFDGYNDIEDNVFYTKHENTSYGVGFGYRWQWLSGWNISSSIAINQSIDKYSNERQHKTEKNIFLIPGLMFGYAF